MHFKRNLKLRTGTHAHLFTGHFNRLPIPRQEQVLAALHGNFQKHRGSANSISMKAFRLLEEAHASIGPKGKTTNFPELIKGLEVADRDCAAISAKFDAECKRAEKYFSVFNPKRPGASFSDILGDPMLSQAHLALKSIDFAKQQIDGARIFITAIQNRRKK